VTEYRFFDPENPPDWLDPEYWTNTPNCDHLAHPAGVHTARIEAAALLAYQTACEEDLTEIVDIGAGDGALLQRVRRISHSKSLGGTEERVTAYGYEIVRDSIRAAADQRGVHVDYANVTDEAFNPKYLGRRMTPFQYRMAKNAATRLVVATEFFEHLADPHAMVRWLSKRAEWIIASSPWGETPGKHEWNHARSWDHEGYRALFEDNGWYVLDMHTIEWSQLIVARRTK
jgi:hypothetical protein